MSYENKHILRDGKILLYTRNGRPTYHARLKVEGHKDYIVKSTKRTNLPEATRVAEDIYDDLRYKVRHGLEVKPHTFGSLWKRWLKSHENVLSEYRIRYFKGTGDRYFLPFFGELSLEQISEPKIAAYWDWRINYWSSAEGQAKVETAQKSRTTGKRPYKQKLGNVAKVPAQKTLMMEQTALLQVFRWANSMGLMNKLPSIKAPKIHPGKTTVRRPAFDLDEWRTLYRYLRKWVTDSVEPNSLKRRGAHSLHLWQRELIRSYILFLGTSGLRPNEARQLRWKDVEDLSDENGKPLLLHIAPTTKTGERECVPLKTASRYLNRIRNRSLFTEPEHLVFCDRNGRAVENFGKTFKKVLIGAGLLKDRHGRVRTIYSLRHTYATFRLVYGKANIEDLAQNMGTSPATIYDHYRHVHIRSMADEMSGKLHPEMSRKGLVF